MEKVYNELTGIINSFYSKYKDLDDSGPSIRTADDSWSPKEIIGHLVDSASNNHQRFIRMQLVDELIFPDYGKDNRDWVKIARYNEINFHEVLLLWKQYNLLLAGIIKNVDPLALENCWLQEGQRLTLSFLANDYLRHLRGHLQQFEETLTKNKSG